MEAHQEILIPLYVFCLFVQAGWRDGGAPGGAGDDREPWLGGGVHAGAENPRWDVHTDL